MEWALTAIGALTLCYLVFTLIEFMVGFRQIKPLRLTERQPNAALPPVSIIFSALNEERELEAALLTLLKQDYPQFEVIAVNDRSSDKTPEILEKLAKQYPHLRIHHIHHLPQGWLGKNHALHTAFTHSTGQWLLFTDADVLMHEQTLAKTVSHVLQHQLDHLTICEHHLRKGFWLKVLFLGHYLAYAMSMKPWRIRQDWSKRSLGHGAFNLVSRAAYQRAGGHQAIAMECLDDLKLGEIIKASGHKQDIVEAHDFVAREWYGSLKDMIEGLKKNCFAVFNYQLWRMVRDCTGAAIIYFLPLFGALFFTGPVRYINMLNIFVTLCMALCVARYFRVAAGFVLFYPAGIAILLYTLCNSMFSAYKHNGVIWRGTHYPLKTLKKLR